MRLTVLKILDTMAKHKYKVFNTPAGHNLNIVGIRSKDTEANKFNDWICVFYTLDKQWNFFAFPATTDPGKFYRNNPINVKGTAFVLPGQYPKLWQLGKHKGRYKALVQTSPVKISRHAGMALPNMGMGETGLFGINLHRASRTRASTQVDRWSAGCQVLQDPDHFDFLIALCKKQVAKLGYKTFTYTLLEEADFE